MAQAAGVKVEVRPRQVGREEPTCGTEDTQGARARAVLEPPSSAPLGCPPSSRRPSCRASGTSVASPGAPSALQQRSIRWAASSRSLGESRRHRAPAGSVLGLLFEHHRSLLRLPQGAKGRVKGKSGPYRQHRPLSPSRECGSPKYTSFRGCSSPTAPLSPSLLPGTGRSRGQKQFFLCNYSKQHASEQTELVTVQDRVHRAGRTHHLQLPRLEFQTTGCSASSSRSHRGALAHDPEVCIRAWEHQGCTQLWRRRRCCRKCTSGVTLWRRHSAPGS